MKSLLLSAITLPVVLLASTLPTSAEPTSFSISTDYVSEYVFRGVTLAGPAVQPGIELGIGDFTAGVWTSVALGEESIVFGDEMDFYAGYSFALGGLLSADIGVTLYHYPQLGGVLDIGTDPDDASTLEVYGSLGLDAPLSPSVNVYYDFTLKALTLDAGAGYSFPLFEKTSFDLNGTVGLVTIDAGTDYQYGSTSAALAYAYTETSSAYIGVNVGISSEDIFADVNFDPLDPTTISAPTSSSVWFGIGFSAGF